MAPSSSSINRSVALLAAVILFSACAGSGRARYDSPADAFAKGKEYYDARKYDRAIPYLQGVFDFGRAHEYAADAALMLARAYRANGDYLLAANEYQRFIQIYRTNPLVEQATFEYAMTFIDRSPAVELDQTDTERAVSELQLYIDRYPDGPNVATADAEIKKLREKLGRKGYESGRLYERRGLYEAAAITFEGVFDRYPDTEWADDALAGAIRNYVAFSRASVASKQAERYKLAVDLYVRMSQIFPDSPLLDDVARVVQSSSDLAAS